MSALESTAGELAQALADLDARPPVPAHRIVVDVDFWARLEAIVARAEAAHAHYRRHHPRPLPIDGHAYARRRRTR